MPYLIEYYSIKGSMCFCHFSGYHLISNGNSYKEPITLNFIMVYSVFNETG